MNVPESNLLTFPVKLKRIVDAPETDHLIYWDEDGLSFHIVDENQLARDVIPNYFKHNNISSFIRQLNMYDFHKKNRVENGLAVIGSGKDDSQWSHEYFVRDKPELLQNITRKVTNAPLFNGLVSKRLPNNETEILAYESVKNDISFLAKAVQHLKQRDEETSDKLKTLQEENHQLYSELMYLREEHDKQSKLIEILVKFFSLYTKSPQDSRLKSKRGILALEMPNSKDSTKNIHEPPKKYFVTSPSTSPQVTVSNEHNNSYKGKKVIKITSVNPNAHIDIKTTNSILNNSNNIIYGIPNINNKQKEKPQRIFTISLPKNTNNVLQSNRAITSSCKKPTIIIPQSIENLNLLSKCQPAFTVKTNFPKKNFDTKKIAKTVTVSSIDSSPETIYNAQYFNCPIETTAGVTDNNNISSNETDYFNLDDILNSPISKEENLKSLVSNHEYNSQNNNSAGENNVSSMISDISANVTSVGQSLNHIKKCLSTDNSYPSNTVTQSNIYDLNFESDLDDSNFLLHNVDEVPDDDFKMLWRNIKNDNLEDDFLISDPGKIQGHELIPFHTHRNDWQEPVNNNADDFSIDDFLETPIIHPEESSISLDGLKDSIFKNQNLFHDNL